jgi:hypothetical protein
MRWGPISDALLGVRCLSHRPREQAPRGADCSFFSVWRGPRHARVLPLFLAVRSGQFGAPVIKPADGRNCQSHQRASNAPEKTTDRWRPYSTRHCGTCRTRPAGNATNYDYLRQCEKIAAAFRDQSIGTSSRQSPSCRSCFRNLGATQRLDSLGRRFY